MGRFDEAAAKWDEKASRVEMAKLFAKEIAEMIELKKSDVLLDYGCGTGTCALALSEYVGRIEGVDASEKMLEMFEKKCKDMGVEEYRLLKHNFEDSDLHDIGSIDVVVSTMTMHHIKEPKFVLEKLYGLINSGGHIAICDLEAEDGTFHDHGNDGVEHLGFEVEEFQQILKDVGFTDIKYKRVKTISKNDKEYYIFLISGKKA